MKFSIDIDDEIDTFFQPPPQTGPGPGNVRSILYLLRRDLRDLTVAETAALGEDTKAIAPVLASSGIMIGFELLARIWVGENDLSQNKMKPAFEEMLDIDARAATLLVQFRNAVAHGYQLEIHARDKAQYRFALGDHVGRPLWFDERGKTPNLEYHLNFWEMRNRFLKAIARVEKTLRDPNQTERRENFYKMLPYLKPYLMVSSPESAKRTA